MLVVFAVFGCKSAPPEAEQPVEPQDELSVTSAPVMPNDDVWSMLSRGDNQVKGFFNSQVDVHSADQNGKTPLHYAAERGDDQLAAFFISIGANINALDNYNNSPLSICAEKNNSAIAGLLARAGADIHLPVRNGTSAAIIAMNGTGYVFRAMLTPSSTASADHDGKTVLHLASIAGNIRAVDEILAAGDTLVLIDKEDNQRKNALDYALQRPDSKNHMIIAEKLIVSGFNSDEPVFDYLAQAARSANYNIRRGDGLAPVHYAVQDNSYGLISFLFDKKIDVNIKNASGSSPLHEAARTGNIPVMRMLLDQGALVNARDAKGNTPLHIGIPADVHREAINLLLERGADPNIRDEHGESPLHIVVSLSRSTDIIQTLLGGGSDVQIRNMQGKTPLYIAVQEKRITLIPVLLSYGSDVFAADNFGITPFDLALKDSKDVYKALVTNETVLQNDSAGNTMLHAAVRNRGNSEHFGMILDHRALVDSRNRAGDTALHIAVRTNQRENGEFLISRGANIFAPNSSGETPLYLALTSSDGIRRWMINSTTITAKDGLGNNMLHYAAQYKLANAIPIIVQSGIYVDEPNATGETPLFMAVKNDSPAVIKALLDCKANLNARDSQGNTLLHAAIRWNTKNSSILLIASGIDINAHALNGNTAIHDAVTLGMTEIVELLITKGANLEVRDVDGNTPFMKAIKTGFIPSIEMLAYNGADPFTRNTKGDTPLHLAVSEERYDLVNMLLRMGASIHARNTRNVTPFRLSLSQSPRMVSGLLTKDRINSPDDLGNSALHIALQEKTSPYNIRAIIDQGIRINTVDNNGRSPLRLALDLDMPETAKILADAGSDPFLPAVDSKTSADLALAKGEDYVRALFSGKAINAKDSSANTILHLAARHGTPDTINILLELGANKALRNIAGETPADIANRWNRRDNALFLQL